MLFSTAVLSCFPFRHRMSELPCKKREDYLEWPEYFMAVAFLSAQRSKDPNSQVSEFYGRMFRPFQTHRSLQMSNLQKEETGWTPVNLQRQSKAAAFCDAFLHANIFLWESKLSHDLIHCLLYPSGAMGTFSLACGNCHRKQAKRQSS